MPGNADRKNRIRRFRDRYLAAHPGEGLTYQQAGQWFDTHSAVKDWLHDASPAELVALRAAVLEGENVPVNELADALLPVALHATAKIRGRQAVAGRLPTGPGGMSKAWRDFALDLREALTLVQQPTDPCLPGEPAACGHDYAEHCLSYMAQLQAYGEIGLDHLHHGDPAIADLAAELLAYWREYLDFDDELDFPG